ncbi:hypothetical protein [uncultured Campylobacter sp.]|uniref:hypothetical protein n=1 Tax=uncultured Campylobacter sp. TaxID=218934 RepID=UPI00260A82CD|nr:hypothetical protein [uncultured Campylobacter sp.]
MVARRILIFLLLLVSVSFSSDFDKQFSYLKSRFFKLTPSEIAKFVCMHTKDADPYGDHFGYTTYGYQYSYYCKNEKYIIDFRPHYNSSKVNILNYKALTKFLNETTYGIKRTICKDPVFKAALNFNIRLEFKIYDSRDSLQETLTFNRNVTPACGLIR